MKKPGKGLLTLTFVVSCLFALNPVFAATTGDSWISEASMPTARAYLKVAVVNDIIYTIGGSGPVGTNEVYDPATNNWVRKASMPDPQQSFGIAVCQGKIYCIGGMSPDVSDSNKVYDPLTDSWETKAAMPTARYGLQTQVVDDKIYVIGGQRLLGHNLGSEKLNVTEIYDPATDTWSMGSPIPALEDCVSVVIDSRIYVIGQTTQIYDPKTDSWSVGASPIYKEIFTDSSAGAATTGTKVSERIYVYNGSTLQVYDPATDNWTLGTAPPTSRQYLGIGVVNDRLYFIGGMSWPIPDMGSYYTFHDTNERYTPVGYATPVPSNSQSNSEPLSTLPIVLAVVAVAVVASVVVYLKKQSNGCTAFTE